MVKVLKRERQKIESFTAVVKVAHYQTENNSGTRTISTWRDLSLSKPLSCTVFISRFIYLNYDDLGYSAPMASKDQLTD